MTILNQVSRLTKEQRQPIHVWRAASLTRRLCAALIGAAVLTAAWLIVAPPTDAVNPTRSDFAVPIALCLIVATVTYRCAFHARLTATAWGLIATNPVFERRVPWSEVTGAEACKDGIQILREDRWPVTAWAVQKAPISRLRRRATRADIVVQELVDVAQAHGAPLTEEHHA